MRIGLSTSVIQRGKTGVAQYVFALTRALLEHADRHEFVLFVLQEDLPLFEFARERMRLVPVEEQWRPAVRNILWHQARLPSLVAKLGIEALHIPSYRRMLWPRPCGLVATIHDLAPFHVSGKYDWKRMLYGKVIVRRLAWRQHVVLAISHNTAADIERFFGLPASRVTVVHNGLDHDRFQPGDSAEARAGLAKRFGLTKPFFLYISRLEHPAKNHVRLIQAFERFKSVTGSEWELVLGGSDWNGAEFVHAAIAQSPVRESIRCLGFVSDADLPGFYRAAGALTYPSLYEGFGFPPVEAMACQCPVLSSTRGSLGEVVGDAALKVDPENTQAMSVALERLATDESLRSSLIRAGVENARRFQWKRVAQACVDAYARAIAIHTNPRSARANAS